MRINIFLAALIGGAFFGAQLPMALAEAASMSVVASVTEGAVKSGADSNSASMLAKAAGQTLDEEAKLLPADGRGGDEFGFSVSISGSRALIGTPFHNGNGAAYVFVFDGHSWIEQAQLTAADGRQGDAFGWSVAIDGDRALVGAIDANNAAGAAYIFGFDGTSWSQQARITSADSVRGDSFGWSAALKGNRALIGAAQADSSGGSVYVYADNGTGWHEQAKLVASDGAPDDSFGFRLSLSGDRALIGAPGDDDLGASSGSAYVFSFDGSSWSEEAKLTPSDGAFATRFGISVSLDGERALVGAYGDAENGVDSGAAYVFQFEGTSWSERAKLTAAGEETADNFGYSVSLSGDHALIGSREAGESGGSSGAAYIFAFNGTSWAEDTKLAPRDGHSGDLFGYSVSLDGNRALISAVYDGDNGEASGSAYIFSLPDVTIGLRARTPKPRIPPAGGALVLRATLANKTDQVQTFDFWTELVHRGGILQSPSLGPFKVTLAPGEVKIRQFWQRVPAALPPGTYTYTGAIGVFPDEKTAASSIDFRKLRPSDLTLP